MAIDKVERFTAVINKTADKKVKKFEAQAQEFLEREIASLEDEFEKKLENRLHFETERIRSTANKEITSLQNASKKEISKRRSEIRREVFEDVKTRLNAFTASNEYNSFLKRSIDSVISSLGDDAIIYACERDLDAVKKLANNHEVKVSDEINIGGIYASNKNATYYIYDTLDSRLDAQFDNFLSVADLSV